MNRQGYFIESGSQQIFVSDTQPKQAKAHLHLVILPPLLEEMNASRNLCSRLAEQAACAGIRTLQFDFSGTGDSSGQLKEMTLQQWQQDLNSVLQLTQNQQTLLLAVYSGGLLIPDSWPTDTILGWHPILSGKEWVNPIRLAQQLAKLKGESSLAYAGYQLPESLKVALQQKEVEPPAHALYQQALKPDADNALDTPPFWLHQELPLEKFLPWLEQSLEWLKRWTGAKS